MSVIPETTQINPRYRQLDSLRGLAALFVFFSHFFLIYPLTFRWLTTLQRTPLSIFINGRAAVMFFFVLSGFVLSLPFIKGTKLLQLTEFYTKRIFRIYPAYLFAIFFAVFLKTFIYDKTGMGPFTIWLRDFWNWDWNRSNYIEIAKTCVLVGPHFNANLIVPVIWSLIIEMKMSFLLPFFIVIASRSNTVFNIAFLFILLLLIYNHAASYLGIFYLGVLLAKYKEVFIAKIKSFSYPLLIAIILVCVIAYDIGYELPYNYKDTTHPFSFFWRDYLNALSCCVLIVIAIGRKKITDLLHLKFFTFLGDVSYSFYLLHLPLLIAFSSLISSRFPASSLFIFLSAILAAFIISYLSFKYIEKPFQVFAKKLTEKRKLFKTLTINSQL